MHTFAHPGREDERKLTLSKRTGTNARGVRAPPALLYVLPNSFKNALFPSTNPDNEASVMCRKRQS